MSGQSFSEATDYPDLLSGHYYIIHLLGASSKRHWRFVVAMFFAVMVVFDRKTSTSGSSGGDGDAIHKFSIKPGRTPLRPLFGFWTPDEGRN